ncbi:MAG: protein kinase, partial [Gemmatimonadaceae bacterium]
TDDIIVQRYVEIHGALEKVLAVVKMRRSKHSPEFRRYQITATGAAVGEQLLGYDGILTGMPTRRDESDETNEPTT